MNNYITLKLTQSSDVETLGVETGTNSIQLSPNSKSTTSLAFGYRFITYSLKYTAKFLPGNDDDDTRGKTKSGGMGFGFNFNHWQQFLSFSKTTGYYLENTADYDPDWENGKPYIQFPNLVYKNYEGITAYNFNPNFSVSAIATQSTRQLKSAGSFIPHALYRYYIIDDQSPITGTSQTQKSDNFEFLVGAGYYYTYVLRQSFYVSLGLTPAAGIVISHLDTRSADETIHTKSQNAIFRIDGRAGLGYNGQRFFSGAYMKFSGSSFQQGSTTAITEDNRVIVQVFLGYRLNAPKWMREPVQAVIDKASFK
ncbi:DUF4421 family protein [Flavihumibacter fluvii]|uniref:DUF4421 family protein n=1 Tax=Flavihumibacter fluvii TaxID=2838157 RepID=UPI001BDDD1A9|nr:DUF4421 family protein [Flavihumibacter fluvii]ULQ54594.1 DUF4421 domain-containing protein [Flavihumibacter fluvii]